MRTGRLRLAAIGCALLLASCVSETKQTAPIVWKDGTPPTPPAESRATPATTRTREPARGEVVEISKEVMDDLMRFVNRLQVVIGDRIEVDASRIPFQVAMVPVGTPDTVETVELAAPELKASGIVMRSLVEVPLVETDFCRLRIGDGIDLAAGKEIQARCYTAVDPDRPAFLVIRALGHALYKDVAAGRRITGDQITVELAVVRQGGSLVFRSSVRSSGVRGKSMPVTVFPRFSHSTGGVFDAARIARRIGVSRRRAGPAGHGRSPCHAPSSPSSCSSSCSPRAAPAPTS